MGEVWNLRKRDRSRIFSDAPEREAPGGHGTGKRSDHAHADESLRRTRRTGGGGDFSGLGCGQLRNRDYFARGWRGTGERSQSVTVSRSETTTETQSLHSSRKTRGRGGLPGCAKSR